MKRGILMLTVLGLILTACASDDTGGDGGEESCAKEDLNLVTPGVLTIATGEPAFPPWVGTTDGEAFDQPESGIGFEAALAYEIADGLGFTNEEVAWVRTDFNEAIAVGPKTFDFNLQQYSITAERDEVVDFSEPYYVTNQALVGLSDSPVASATSIADLKAYNLGAQIGTTSFEYIEEVIQPDTPASAYDTNADAKSAIDAGQQFAFVVLVRIAEFEPHQETIELGLRQWKGADLVRRVLRGDDEKRLRKGARVAVDRDLVFLHRLEQCALRLGRRPVDLVGEDQLREYRPRLEFEFAAGLPEHRDADDIGWQQVAGELDAAEAQTEDPRE